MGMLKASLSPLRSRLDVSISESVSSVGTSIPSVRSKKAISRASGRTASIQLTWTDRLVVIATSIPSLRRRESSHRTSRNDEELMRIENFVGSGHGAQALARA